jgi:hypothetical protein
MSIAVFIAVGDQLQAQHLGTVRLLVNDLIAGRDGVPEIDVHSESPEKRHSLGKDFGQIIQTRNAGAMKEYTYAADRKNGGPVYTQHPSRTTKLWNTGASSDNGVRRLTHFFAIDPCQSCSTGG